MSNDQSKSRTEHDSSGTELYYDECNVPTCDDGATENAVLKDGDEIAGAVSYCDDHAKERGVDTETGR